MESEVMRKFNKLVADMMPHEPRYRYYQHGNRYFCWTTEKAMCKGKEGFIAFVRKELVSKRTKTRRVYKLVKQVRFARRKKAKERALMWYNSWMDKKLKPEGETINNDQQAECLAEKED